VRGAADGAIRAQRQAAARTERRRVLAVALVLHSAALLILVPLFARDRFAIPEALRGQWTGHRPFGLLEAFAKDPTWIYVSVSLAILPILYWIWRGFGLPLGRVGGLVISVAALTTTLVALAPDWFGIGLAMWAIAAVLSGAAFVTAPALPVRADENALDVRRLLRQHRASDEAG
jgi:hypothetical protein